jgi:hypothetical protein
VKWTEYPTRADMADRVNGTERSGQRWSDAPGPGEMWARPDGSKRCVLVIQRRGSHDGKPYSIADGSHE